MYEYINGNYTVEIFSDGTRVKTCESNNFVSAWPDNIDCKITNWCDNPHCMQHCHERSNPSGVHGDVEFGLELLSQLPAGVEIAIGGGATQSHPKLELFLRGLRKIGLIPNLTINQYHFTNELCEKLTSWYNEKLCFGVGISYIGSKSNNCDAFTNINEDHVWHVIAGIHTPDDVRTIISKSRSTPKILILGYKEHGNGIKYYTKHSAKVQENITKWYRELHEFFNKGAVISFDNLAIKQLNVKRFFTDANWDKFYQGDDGEANMYIDLVAKTAAVSSRSNVKLHIDYKSLSEAFEWVKVNKNQ